MIGKRFREWVVFIVIVIVIGGVIDTLANSLSTQRSSDATYRSDIAWCRANRSDQNLQECLKDIDDYRDDQADQTGPGR